MSGDGITDDGSASIAGPGAESTFKTVPPDPAKKPTAVALVEEFLARNHNPDARTLYSYAAVQVMDRAAEAAKMRAARDEANSPLRAKMLGNPERESGLRKPMRARIAPA